MPVDQVTSLSSNTTGLPGLSSLTGTLQGGISNLLNMGGNMLDRFLPPPKREEIKRKVTRFATEKPYLASFLASQIAFSGLPMFLFIIMVISVAIFALITGLLVGLLGAVLFILAAVGFALIILLPTLFFTTFAAVGIWLFGVGTYYIVKHFSQGQGSSDVPMGDGLKTATGLDNPVSGLGPAHTKHHENQRENVQHTDGTNGSDGTVDREKDSRPMEEQPKEERPSQPIRRKPMSVKKKSPELNTAATSHVENAATGMEGFTNGAGAAVGV